MSLLANAALAAALLGGLDALAEEVAKKLGPPSAPAGDARPAASPTALSAPSSEDARATDDAPETEPSASPATNADPAPTPEPDPAPATITTPTPEPTPATSAPSEPAPEAEANSPTPTGTPSPDATTSVPSEPPRALLFDLEVGADLYAVGETVGLQIQIQQDGSRQVEELEFSADGVAFVKVVPTQPNGYVRVTWSANTTGTHRLSVRDTSSGEMRNATMEIAWMRILSVDSPRVAPAGQPWVLQVTVFAGNGAPSDTLALYVDNVLVGTETVTAPPGQKVYGFTYTPAAGRHTLGAMLSHGTRFVEGLTFEAT